jgi:hypothetical protein
LPHCPPGPILERRSIRRERTPRPGRATFANWDGADEPSVQISLPLITCPAFAEENITIAEIGLHALARRFQLDLLAAGALARRRGRKIEVARDPHIRFRGVTAKKSNLGRTRNGSPRGVYVARAAIVASKSIISDESVLKYLLTNSHHCDIKNRFCKLIADQCVNIRSPAATAARPPLQMPPTQTVIFEKVLDGFASPRQRAPAEVQA